MFRALYAQIVIEIIVLITRDVLWLRRDRSAAAQVLACFVVVHRRFLRFLAYAPVINCRESDALRALRGEDTRRLQRVYHIAVLAYALQDIIAANN